MTFPRGRRPPSSLVWFHVGVETDQSASQNGCALLTLIAGLLAIAVNRAYHNAGWAWVKLAAGFWSSRAACTL